jgi:maltose/moltooligosaccharide transporter
VGQLVPTPTVTSERRFLLLFLPIALGFGGRMALVAFNGPLARLFTDNGYLIGLLLAVGPLISALVNPALGRLSDRTWTRFGRRLPYVLVGVPLANLVLFAIPSAPSYPVLLGLFLLGALLISIGGVPLLSLIPDMVAPERRGRAMALFMVAGSIGAIAIQMSGKFLWESHFELVYYLTALLALVFVVPPLFFIRESPPRAGELEAARGRSGWSPRTALASLVRGDPIALFLASASLRYLGVGVAIAYFTLFAVTDLGVPVGDAALAIGVTGAVRIALAIPSGRLADRWSRKRLLVGTTGAAVAVHLATALAVFDLTGLYLVLLAGAVVGTLDMVVSGPLFMDLMPADRRGELTGINMVLQNVFRALGALLGGAVFAWSGGYRLSFAAVALCFAVSAVILSRVRVTAPAESGSRPPSSSPGLSR